MAKTRKGAQREEYRDEYSLKSVCEGVLCGCYVKNETCSREGENSDGGIYKNREKYRKILKTKGKINVENSVGNVDNSLHSAFQNAFYVKPGGGKFGGMPIEKMPKIRAFFHAYAVENGRMGMHRAAVIPRVIVPEKKNY